VISVTHFAVTPADADFGERAADALQVLAARPGYVRGTLGRSTDDERHWVLVTYWQDVGSYRRALGAYDVKLRATPLLAQAVRQDSSFEALLSVEAGGATVVRASDRSDLPRD
jgi:hypothetical protein